MITLVILDTHAMITYSVPSNFKVLYDDFRKKIYPQHGIKIDGEDIFDKFLNTRPESEKNQVIEMKRQLFDKGQTEGRTDMPEIGIEIDDMKNSMESFDAAFPVMDDSKEKGKVIITSTPKGEGVYYGLYKAHIKKDVDACIDIIKKNGFDLKGHTFVDMMHVFVFETQEIADNAEKKIMDLIEDSLWLGEESFKDVKELYHKNHGEYLEMTKF